MNQRQKVVNLVKSWEGLNERDGSFKKIIDIYNSYKGPLPRHIKMQYSWSWCACTWSALAIQLGLTDIMPIEISCGELVKAAKEKGIWVENDGYVANPGDGILYDWDDSGKGDNTGWPDHVGTIIQTNQTGGYFVVMEGNYSNSVKKRTISINGKFIRGFICPKYDETDTDPVEASPVTSSTVEKTVTDIAREVIAGDWGSGDERKRRLKEAGYSPELVQDKVNALLNGNAAVPKTPIQNQLQPVEKYVKATCLAKSHDSSLNGRYKTTADLGLYLRNDAGTNKKALCKIPKDTSVMCYGYYTAVGNVKWLYITVTVDGVRYTGFSSSSYLKKM